MSHFSPCHEDKWLSPILPDIRGVHLILREFRCVLDCVQWCNLSKGSGICFLIIQSMFALILCLHCFNCGSRISGLTLHATVMKLEMHAEIQPVLRTNIRGGGSLVVSWCQGGCFAFRYGRPLLVHNLMGITVKLVSS